MRQQWWYLMPYTLELNLQTFNYQLPLSHSHPMILLSHISCYNYQIMISVYWNISLNSPTSHTEALTRNLTDKYVIFPHFPHSEGIEIPYLWSAAKTSSFGGCSSGCWESYIALSDDTLNKTTAAISLFNGKFLATQFFIFFLLSLLNVPRFHSRWPWLSPITIHKSILGQRLYFC